MSPIRSESDVGMMSFALSHIRGFRGPRNMLHVPTRKPLYTSSTPRHWRNGVASASAYYARDELRFHDVCMPATKPEGQ